MDEDDFIDESGNVGWTTEKVINQDEKNGKDVNCIAPIDKSDPSANSQKMCSL